MSRSRESARRAIIEAAWRLVDRRGVVQLVAGVSVRDIAEEIGISPSTVSYHFGSQEGLAWAMIDSLVEERDLEPLRVLTEMLGSDSIGLDASELVRLAAQGDWDELVRPESAVFERRLMRTLAATGSSADGDRIAARLRDGVWREYLGPFTALIDAVCVSQQLRFVEPFTSLEVARIATATIERLLHQYMIDPESIRPDLAADAMVAFFSAVLKPDHARLGIDELEASMRSLSRPDEVDPELLEWRRHVAAAAAPLFDRPANQVSLTDVAAASETSVRMVADRFRSSNEVAAVSVHRYMKELRAAVERRLDQDIEVALTDYLCEIARLARIDPIVWGALGLERQRAVFESGPGIHVDVPLDLAVQAALRAIGVNGTDGERTDLSRLVVDTVLSYSLTRPAVAPHVVAALALRLVNVPS